MQRMLTGRKVDVRCMCEEHHLQIKSGLCGAKEPWFRHLLKAARQPSTFLRDCRVVDRFQWRLFPPTLPRAVTPKACLQSAIVMIGSKRLRFRCVKDHAPTNVRFHAGVAIPLKALEALICASWPLNIDPWRPALRYLLRAGFDCSAKVLSSAVAS